jgi:lysozyme family protein
MSNFENAVAMVLKLEGGYSNDPHDAGGETNWGITKREATDYGYSGSMRELPLQLAKAIYLKDYWQQCRCDELTPPLDILVFDCAVNQGPGMAIKLLQRSLGVPDDGIIGPLTLQASKRADASKSYLTERAIRYMTTPGFDRYGKGWLNRIFSIALSV